MDVFIRIITTGDTAPLTVENWNDIMIDYHTAMLNKKTLRALAHEREIRHLENKIYLTQVTVLLMANTQDAGVADLLRSWGHRYEYSAQSIEADLLRVLGSLKQHEARIGQLKHDLALMNTGGSVPTKADFYKEFDQLAEFSKVAVIDPAEITVAQYCAKLSRFTQHVEAQIKANGSR